MKNKLSYITIVFVFLSQMAFAQAYKPLRVEYSSRTFDQLRIIPAGPDRVISFLHHSKRSSRGDLWQVNGLDASFNTVWSQDILIPRAYVLSEYEIERDSILHLLISREGGDNASFLKLRLNIINGKYSVYFFKGNRRALLVGLKLLNDRIYLYGLGLENIQSQLDEYNAGTHNEKIVTAKVPGQYYILAAMADSVHNRFIIIAKNKKSDSGELHLLEFDTDGNLTQDNILGQMQAQNLVTGNLVYSDKKEIFFIGTFNYNTGKKRRAEEEVAVGEFIGKIKDNKFEFFRFYRFAEFTNILKTLSFREQQKVRMEKGKGKSVDLYLNILMHKTILNQDGLFILVGESYYPVYHYETMYDGRGYMYQTEVFDGYQTTSAMAAAFDDKGNLVWDNYIQVNGVQTYYLEENVTVYNDNEDGTQVFTYYLNEHIYSKVTKGNETIFKKEATALPTVASGEQVLAEDNGKITHWHSSFFLISGYQKVYGLDNKSRKVFFITAVAFR